MSRHELQDFPTNILIDAMRSSESVFIHPDQSMFTNATVAQAMTATNEAYTSDPAARIRHIVGTTRWFLQLGTLGLPTYIKNAYDTDESDADSNEIMAVTSPLNDGRPLASAKRYTNFAHTEHPSQLRKLLTQPNSINPATKLDVGREFMKASGRSMPFLQLYSRLQPRALHTRERWDIWHGDHEAFGRVMLAGLDRVNVQRDREGKTPIETVHLFGAGMVQRTLGVASYLLKNQDRYEVGSVVGLNPVFGRDFLGMGKDHLSQALVEEASNLRPPEDFERTTSLQIRKDLDHKGGELNLTARQLRAMLDLSYMWAMTQPEPSIAAMDAVLRAGIPTRMIVGLNTGMAKNSIKYLPIEHPLFNLSTVLGIEGQKVGMKANEHAGVVAVAMSAGIADYDTLRAA